MVCQMWITVGERKTHDHGSPVLSLLLVGKRYILDHQPILPLILFSRTENTWVGVLVRVRLNGWEMEGIRGIKEGPGEG